MSGRRGANENRRTQFKFNSITNEELRRRREETQVEIRKAKREDSLNKRRNITEGAGISVDSFEASMGSPSSSISSVPPVPHAGELGRAELMHKIYNLSQMLYSPDLEEQFTATVDFRKILAKEKNAPIQEVIDSGVVSRFVEILSGNTVHIEEGNSQARQKLEELIFEAAWVLTNIASGEASHTQVVVDANAIPYLIYLLRHHNPEIREQSIWALGNIAGDGPKLRNLVLANDILTPLLENMAFALDNPSAHISTIRNGAWTISNLCRGTPLSPWSQVSVALPMVFRLLQVQDDDTLVDVCWTLAYMTSESQTIDDIIAAGIIPALVPLLGHKSISIVVPTLRACGNIVTGSDVQTQSIIDAGALPLLRVLLNHTKTSVVKETCWAISNITAGTPIQIRAAIDTNLLPRVIYHLTYSDYKVKKEAAWAICNATAAHNTDPDHVHYLVSQGCIKPLCDLLKTCQDTRLILVIIDGIGNILEVGDRSAYNSDAEEPQNQYALFVEEAGGLDTIYELQNHPDSEVYEKCKNMIDKFFKGESDDDELTMNSAFNFDPNAAQSFDFS